MENDKRLKLAKDALDEKHFAKAASLYAEVYSMASTCLGDWELWGWARALYKSKKYKEALDICRKAYRANPKFTPIHNIYAWAIYHLVIGEKSTDKATMLKGAQAILKLSPIEDQYGPSMKTLFKVSEFFVANNQLVEALEWLDRIPIADLSTDVFSFRSSDGKKVELASEKEKYFALKSKSLLKLQRYEECIKTCETGLAAFTRFHYNNNIWFRWRIVVSEIGLQAWTKAERVLLEILQKKDDWFFKDAMGEIKMGQGKKKEAMRWLAEAALGFGETDKKIGLFKKMVKLLDELGNIEMVKRHLLLVFSILTKQEWKISDDLLRMGTKYGMTEHTQVERGLFGQLKKDWLFLSMEGRSFKNGVVQSILSNGKAGFIKSGNKTYYFRFADVLDREVSQGQSVQFLLKPGFDKKKNRATEVAYQVKKIQKDA